MAKKEKKGIKGEPSIKIDYDNIDVADIMDQIKRKIAQEAEKPSPEEPIGEEPSATPPPQFQEPPEIEEGETSKITKVKKILLKLMKPFAPLIKLLVLPVHQEVLDTMRALHQTNVRLDSMNARLEESQETLSHRLEGMNDALNRRVDVLGEELGNTMKEEFKKTNKKIGQVSETINKRLDILFADLEKTMEYTKLLHSLSHNVVVELSKLKIEEEDLKIKTRIMEKDFEFLGMRERALEKLIVK